MDGPYDDVEVGAVILSSILLRGQSRASHRGILCLGHQIQRWKGGRRRG